MEPEAESPARVESEVPEASAGSVESVAEPPPGPVEAAKVVEH
jgi:hypothetical protein